VYRVLSNVLHDGVLFEAGQVADFDEKSAKELLLAGAIEKVRPTKVAQKQESMPKEKNAETKEPEKETGKQNTKED
jgi:hypothetical protein